MAKRYAKELLRAQMAGETITDEEIDAARFSIIDYEITSGDMSQAWHTCTKDELEACWEAYRALAARARAADAKRNAPLAPEEEAAVARAFQAAHLEDRAQDAEDNDDLDRASRLRGQASKVRGG